MAQTAIFGNKVIKLPGAYARVVSGIETEAALASYSNVLLIDTGAGNGFNSIKGIVGNGKECIYALDYDSANYYIKGGPLAPVIEALYNPDTNKPGIGTLHLIKAATSTPASVATPISLFGGAITATALKTVEQGTICNTEIEDEVLRQGFLFKAIYDKATSKAYVEIHQGTYQGTNFGGYSIGNEKENSVPTIIYRSKKCNTPDDLVSFLQRSQEFKDILEFEGLKVVKQFGDDAVSSDLTFTGGTDTYAENLTDILPMTTDVDYSCMFICEKNGEQKMVPAALDHIVNDAKGIKQILTYEADFDEAILKAREYDSDSLIVAAGVSKQTSKTSPTGFIIHDTMVNGARCLGRIFGLSPEIPATMKSLGIDGMEVEPSDADLENMLDNGVIAPYYDADLGGFVLSQACNSLQANTQLINEDCSTYSIQAKRILAQVVKNLQLQAKLDFWGGENAVNKATLSDAYLKAWTETLLSKLTVAPNKTENNYLLDYQVTKVATENDTKRVFLSVTVNGEITKILFLVTVLG